MNELGSRTESQSGSVMSNSLWLHGRSPWNSPGQNTGVGSLSLLQGIFPTQGSKPSLPHCRWILLPTELSLFVNPFDPKWKQAQDAQPPKEYHLVPPSFELSISLSYCYVFMVTLKISKAVYPRWSQDVPDFFAFEILGIFKEAWTCRTIQGYNRGFIITTLTSYNIYFFKCFSFSWISLMLRGIQYWWLIMFIGNCLSVTFPDL